MRHLSGIRLNLITDLHPEQRMQEIFTRHVNDSTEQLLTHQRKKSKVFSWKFLEWLVSEEEHCNDSERKAQMSDLAARLVTLRRGVIPMNAHANARLEESSTTVQADRNSNLGRWPVQVKWRPEDEMALHERVWCAPVQLSTYITQGVQASYLLAVRVTCHMCCML